MIPGISLVDFIGLVGVLGVALVIFAESGLLIGFFLPGDSLLFTAGFLTYGGLVNINIHLLVAIMFIAAIAGDSVGYTFGRRVGIKLFNRTNSRLFKQEYAVKAQGFYDKYGGKAIVLARFIPIIRTFAPIVAGVGKMRYSRFVSFNIIGGLLWTVVVTYSGYFLGQWFESMGISIDRVLLPIVILIILLSVTPPVLHVMKDKKQRSALWNGAKQQLYILFKKK